jgi:uncharacterized damage-inducible protein DinB
MDALVLAYREWLRALHAAMAKSLDGLPRDALDWSPGPEINSLAVLATHVAGAERYWIGAVAGGQATDRVREVEFEAMGKDAAALVGELEAALAESDAVLAQLAVADLGAARVAPLSGKRVTVAWALVHALEHTAQHVGHMELTRQLWELRV